jgi:hypothetical protein
MNKEFTLPKRISPFYGNIRIPRRLKKKVKAWCDIHWNNLTNGQRLWYYLGHSNNAYKEYLINQIK